MRKRQILKCFQCGINFYPKNGNLKALYCSRECRDNSMRGKSKKSVEELVSKKYKYCENCGKKFYNLYKSKSGITYSFNPIRWKNKKYCSHKCFGEADGKSRIGMIETKHPRWIGDNIGYYGVHDWIKKHYGTPSKCEICGLDDVNRVYHWANLSGNYLRDRNDFKRMCVSCHRKYDYNRKREEMYEKVLL